LQCKEQRFVSTQQLPCLPKSGIPLAKSASLISVERKREETSCEQKRRHSDNDSGNVELALALAVTFSEAIKPDPWRPSILQEAGIASKDVAEVHLCASAAVAAEVTFKK
jgi:hypothetical protein